MTRFLPRLAAASFAMWGHAVLSGATTSPARAEPAAPSPPGSSALSVPIDGSAVMAVVSIRDQRISLYDANLESLRSNVSSGMTDYETPVGVYAVLQKKEEHHSNLYDDASMPFMQRITWSGIALHAGALPGRPASHGCVRLPHSFSEEIFPLTRLGMRVVVAYADVSPVPISHPRLFQPEAVAQARAATPIAYEPNEEAGPFEPDVRKWPGRQALLDSLKPEARAKAQVAEAAIARAEEFKPAQKAAAQEQAKAAKAFKRADAVKRKADERAASAQRWLEQVRAKSKPERVVKKAEESAQKAAADAAIAAEKLAPVKAALDAADAELARANADLATAETAKTTAVDAANEAKRKMLPVSAFVSLKTQRLYVRQGHEAVLDMPITITSPEEPIGTYVYTAVTYEEDGNTARWIAVSTGPRAALDDDYGYTPRKKRSKAQTPPPTDLAGAKAALDRIHIPADVAQKLAKYTWPGSSLIISDEELSKETGQATDFVVLISGEPQGGIKKRPKRPPNDYYYYFDDDDYYEDRRYDPYRRYDRRRPKYTPFFSFW